MKSTSNYLKINSKGCRSNQKILTENYYSYRTYLFKIHCALRTVDNPLKDFAKHVQKCAEKKERNFFVRSLRSRGNQIDLSSIHLNLALYMYHSLYLRTVFSNSRPCYNFPLFVRHLFTPPAT